MKQRILLPVLILLLLAATHTAVFLVARTGQGSDAEVREISYLPPAKSPGRATGTTAHPSSTAFTRMLRELEQSGMSRGDFELAREALFREWIRRDLRSVLDLLYGPQTSTRYSHSNLSPTLDDELAKEVARQPREVWGWIASRRYGMEGQEFCQRWLWYLIQSGQTDIAMECLSQDLHFLTQYAIERLSDHVPAAQLPRLRELTARVAGQEEDMDGMSWPEDYARRMAVEAALDPMPFLATEQSPRLRNAFTREWAGLELHYLPATTAAERVRALPEDVRGAAVLALADQGRPGGLSATAALINAVEAAGLLGDPAGDAARNFASAAISSSLMEPTDRVSDYLRAVQAIRAAPLRYLALEEMGVFCRGDDGESPFECMSVLPPGPDRDAFLRSPATSPTLDPAQREKILAAISDPVLAAELRRQVEGMLEKASQRREGE